MIDKRPLLIARCADVADVITAVNFGRDNGLLIAIRGGGHNGPGLGSVDDGLVIDLSTMKGVRVDPASRTVRVGPGCTSGDVDHATHAFGLAVPFGIVSTTGVAGLTLGGGIGLSDAEIRPDHRQSARSRRGARRRQLRHGEQGGESGPVLGAPRRRREFRRGDELPVPGPPGEAWSMPGRSSGTPSTAGRSCGAYRDFLPTAPEELGAFVGLKTVPSMDPFPREAWGKRACAVISSFNGSEEDGKKAHGAAPRQAPAAVLQLDGRHAVPGDAGPVRPVLPEGPAVVLEGDFVKRPVRRGDRTYIAESAKAPSELSLMHLYPIDGAVHRVGKDETAWGARDATWSMVIAGIDPTRNRPGR